MLKRTKLEGKSGSRCYSRLSFRKVLVFPTSFLFFHFFHSSPWLFIRIKDTVPFPELGNEILSCQLGFGTHLLKKNSSGPYNNAFSPPYSRHSDIHERKERKKTRRRKKKCHQFLSHSDQDSFSYVRKIATRKEAHFVSKTFAPPGLRGIIILG